MADTVNGGRGPVAALLRTIRRRIAQRASHRLPFPALTTLALVVPLGVAAGVGQGNPVEELLLSGGGAWVASPEQGLVTLIDGPSEEVAASVRVPAGADGLAVEQAGSSAYVVDPGAGTVARVDGATYEVSTTVRFADPGGGLRVLQGGDGVFVLDAARRTASRVDPRSLRQQETLSLAAQPGPDQAVVDDGGRLWVIDSVGGGLTWFDEGKRVDPDVAAADDRLTLVRGRPVLVDLTDGRVAALNASGSVGRWSCLEVRPGDLVQAVGSRTQEEVYAAVSSTGTVVIAAVGRDDCSRFVAVADPGSNDFGPLAQSDRFLFVPNRTTGETVVVDTRDDTVAGRFDLAEPGHRVDLVDKDGLVFYNDLDGHTAGVLSFDGVTWREGDALDKYDPETGEAAAEVVPEDQDVPSTPDPTTPPATPEPAPASPTPSATPDPEPTGPGPTPAPQVTPPPAAPQITGLTADSATYFPYTDATFTATVNQSAANGTWEWSATFDGAPYAVPVPPGAGNPLTLTLDGLGTYAVTLSVTAAGQTVSRTVEVTVVSDCPDLDTVMAGWSTQVLDLRATGIDSIDLTSPPGCVRDLGLSPSYPGWLDGPNNVTLPAGGAVSIPVSVVGTAPSDGLHDGAIYMTVDGGSGPAFDVRVNIAPVNTNGYTVCVPTGDGRVQFLASYADADLSGLVVRLTVNGQTFSLQSDPPNETLFYGYRTLAQLGAASTWTVRATDVWGLSSPVTNGADSWSCW